MGKKIMAKSYSGKGVLLIFTILLIFGIFFLADSVTNAQSQGCVQLYEGPNLTGKKYEICYSGSQSIVVTLTEPAKSVRIVNLRSIKVYSQPAARGPQIMVRNGTTINAKILSIWIYPN